MLIYVVCVALVRQTNNGEIHISLGLATCTLACPHSCRGSSRDCLDMETPTEPVKHRGWTTPEQFTFLDSHKDDYIKMRQAKGREKTALKNAFWPPLFEQWFEKYPVTIQEDSDGTRSEEDTALLMKMTRKRVETVSAWDKLSKKFPYLGLQKIDNWMSNHTRALTTGGGSKTYLDLGKQKPTSKMLQLSQAFSNLYYHQLVKPEVIRRWKDEEIPKLLKRGVPVPSGPSLPFRNEVLAKVFASQPRDILDRCEKYRKNKHAEQNGLPLPFPENYPVDEKAADESDDWYNEDAEKVAADKAAKMRSVQAQRH